MKKASVNTVIFVALMLFTVSLNARSLTAFFSYCTFTSPTEGPYIETYMNVVGSTVKYLPVENGYQGMVEITLVFKQGEKIVDFKKYNLLSPLLKDTLLYPNFIDQQRISLPNGEYNLEIEIKDPNTTNKAFKSYQNIDINYADTRVQFSDIQLIEEFSKTVKNNILTKSGYDLIPYVTDFLPEKAEKIVFYSELYGTSKMLGENEMFLLNYYIESDESGFILNRYRSFKRMETSVVAIVLHEFNIKKLPSGNYNLVLECRNKKNELMAERKVFFQRSNPSVQMDEANLESVNTGLTFVENYNNIDSLKFYIRSVMPISSRLERCFIDRKLKEADLELCQKYFLNFWKTRNMLDPESSWNQYYDNVEDVENEFKTQIRHGFETDRGRIYLKFGKPNVVSDQKSEPNSYPYQIWHYYTTKRQNNVKFVFYNRDLAVNHYELLHSTARGEIKDYRWKMRLQARSNPMNNLDQTQPFDSHGSRVDDLFNNPR